MAAPAFWSDEILSDTVDVVPANVLRQAARELTAITKGRLEARVKSRGEGSYVVHTLYLFAPTITFSYDLGESRHSELPYPVETRFFVGSDDWRSDDEKSENPEDFKGLWRSYLSSPDVTAVVKGMLATIGDSSHLQVLRDEQRRQESSYKLPRSSSANPAADEYDPFGDD
jgi:hypothetical protein